MSRLLVTGATGFVGRALVPALAAAHRVTLAVRSRSAALAPGIEQREIGEIGPDTDWRQALAGIDEVVHLAAHVHRPGGEDAAFFRVNAAGTERLAAAAREGGIKRILFLSTIKVNGETSGAQPFREADPAHPEGAYAQSKAAAEATLSRLAAGGGPAAIILRPPLVYGPDATANFRALARLCRSGLPLPFAAVDNRRSLIFLGNLVAAIVRVLESPAAPGCRLYLLRDGEDLSTPDLIRRLGAALGRRPRLFAIPPTWLELGFTAAGRSALADRLLRSLSVDDTGFRRDFAWQPPHTVDQGLAETAAAFR